MNRPISILVTAVCLAAIQVALPASAHGGEQAASTDYAEAVYLLDTWIESVLDYDRLPGMSIAVVHDQELVYANGFGFADVERRVKSTPGTIYSICSITKLFTSIAVMQLRDAGELSLDEPVSEYLPWFDPELLGAGSQPLTLRDLLRHSSGLPAVPDHTVWSDPELLYPSREELIERVSRLEFSYPTNTSFNYSNLGYSLLGEVVSVVSGVEYREYLQQNVLEPLGLVATTPYLPELVPGGDLATGYGRWPREGARVLITNSDARALTPAQGFASTVEDLAEFSKWQFRVLDEQDEDVLSRQTLREMQTVQWSDPDWGLGFSIWHMEGRDFIGHQGGCPGYKSQIVLDPEEKIGVVVMINATDAPQFTLAFRAHEILAPVVRGPRDSTVEGSGEWTKYTGFYTADKAWSDAEVLEWNGSLAVMWVPTEDPVGSLVSLRRVEGDVFRQVRSDGKLGKHYIFETDADGSAVRMKFNNNQLRKTVR
jgi:CubicO group peptidase (beta-lactamase class C family)